MSASLETGGFGGAGVLPWVLGARRVSRVAAWVVGALACVGVIGLSAGVASAATVTFTMPGTSTFDVPSNVTRITVNAVARPARPAGANGFGGQGAGVTATVPVSSGDTGWNAGFNRGFHIGWHPGFNSGFDSGFTAGHKARHG